MSEQSQRMDREIIERYTDQPARMPAELRRRIESLWGDRPIELYALADLDAGFRLTETWVALGPEHVAFASRVEDADWEVQSFERGRVEAIRETPGLSGNALSFLAAPDQPALATVRFTHRQRRAMENVKFVIQQQLEGRLVEPVDADA